MPFLYELIKSCLTLNYDTNDNTKNNSDTSDDSDSVDDDLNYQATMQRDRKMEKFHAVASTICSMIQYSANRCANGFQILNSVVFLVCGVTERVAKYLHHVGLCTSRDSANRALVSLGSHGQQKIVETVKSSRHSFLAPLICIDNVDFEEKVHSKSGTRKNQMFHGTWGYLHMPDPKVFSDSNPADFTPQSYRRALLESSNMEVNVDLFTHNNDDYEHFASVIKSQITRVLIRYVATNRSSNSMIPLEPPQVDPIKPIVPKITMMKLMMASDNSLEGILDVLDGILKQTQCKKDDSFSTLVILEGNLDTCKLIESLQALRKPGSYPHNSLINCFTNLGVSHVLWNIAESIFIMHFGDNTQSNYMDAWHLLAALRIPIDRPTTKKDFSITNMVKFHEAIILYLILGGVKYDQIHN